MGTTTEPTIDPRHDFINGLHALAGFYARHPEFPLPQHLDRDIDTGAMTFAVTAYRDEIRCAELVEQLGEVDLLGDVEMVTRDYRHSDHVYVDFRRRFSDNVGLAVTAYRETVCSQTQVDVEPVYDWTPIPALAAHLRSHAAADGRSHVAELRDAMATARAEAATEITCERCSKTTTDPDLWDPEVNTGRVLCNRCWDVEHPVGANV